MTALAGESSTNVPPKGVILVGSKEPDRVGHGGARPELAARRILDIIRKHPGVRHKLQLSTDCTPLDYFESLGCKLNPTETLTSALRESGCTPDIVQEARELLPAAMQVINLPDDVRAEVLGMGGKPVESRWTSRCGLFFIMCAIALIVLAVILAETNKKGWTEGLCNLSLFANRTCDHDSDCAFSVNIKEVGKSKATTMDSWTPATGYSYRKGRNGWIDEPFRCCEDGQGSDAAKRRSCCDCFDEKEYLFCDNWGVLGRSDDKGDSCPEGDWPCLYQTRLNQDNYEDVIALQVYNPPPIGILLGVAGLLITLGLVFLLKCWQCHHLHRWRRQKKSSVVKDAPSHDSDEQALREGADQGPDTPSPSAPKAVLSSSLTKSSGLATMLQRPRALPIAIPEPAETPSTVVEAWSSQEGELPQPTPINQLEKVARTSNKGLDDQPQVIDLEPELWDDAYVNPAHRGGDLSKFVHSKDVLASQFRPIITPPSGARRPTASHVSKGTRLDRGRGVARSGATTPSASVATSASSHRHAQQVRHHCAGSALARPPSANHALAPASAPATLAASGSRVSGPTRGAVPRT